LGWKMRGATRWKLKKSVSVRFTWILHESHQICAKSRPSIDSNQIYLFLQTELVSNRSEWNIWNSNMQHIFLYSFSNRQFSHSILFFFIIILAPYYYISLKNALHFSTHLTFFTLFLFPRKSILSGIQIWMLAPKITMKKHESVKNRLSPHWGSTFVGRNQSDAPLPLLRYRRFQWIRHKITFLKHCYFSSNS
jgi:hypothetical protein